MIKFTIDFDIRIKDFKFFEEILIKGKHNPSFTSNWQKINFDHNIKWDISKHLINIDERKIKFQFKLKIRPDLGEIMFKGECILESPEQEKISFILHNSPQLLNKFVSKFLLKYSYINAEKFAKEQKLLFPPIVLILKRFGIQ